MSFKGRMDRRSWLAYIGATAAGLGGAVLALGGKRRLGVVTSPVAAGGKSDALRVNLGFVSAYLVVRGQTAALVDTGVAGSVDRIEQVVQAAGLSWDNLQHLILTHHHGDHQGSAQDVLDRARNALVWAGPEDIPNIRVNRPVRPAEDGAEVFGLQVVATPGHTLGHISLLDPELGALIIGDAVFNGTIMAGNNVINPEGGLAVSATGTADRGLANASARRLGGLQFDRALFGHGEPIESGASAAIRQARPLAP